MQIGSSMSRDGNLLAQHQGFLPEVCLFFCLSVDKADDQIAMLIVRSTLTQCEDAAILHLLHIEWSVCLYVRHKCQLYRMGGRLMSTQRNLLDGGSRSLTRKGNFMEVSHRIKFG